MIQFNLLPDVKLEFLRTRYRKRLIVGFSVLASTIFFVIFLVLFLFVRVNQTRHMSDLNKDIKTSEARLKENPNLDKILTIQNQLKSLPGLHDQKVVSSRLIDYLGQLTPAQATISDVDVNYEESKIVIKGNADSLITVNKFADSLKFTTYKVNSSQPEEGKAFSSVVLRSFSLEPERGTVTPGNRAIYELEFLFEPAIFALVSEDTTNGEKPVELTVPKIISTRSETERPTDLFAPQPIVEETPTGIGQ